MMQLSELYRPWALDNARWGVQIVEGKFKETVIQIESVDFDEQQEGNMLVDYHTINIPEGLLKEDYDSPEFIDTMQLIMSDIIAKAVEEFKEANGN
jgi:hypothetical protein